MTANCDFTLHVWWTPDCGATHTETDPVSVDLLRCPDLRAGGNDT